MEQAYWYSLGYAAKAHGVSVHAGCLMSTHSHETVTDVRGELPRFLRTFHRLLALTYLIANPVEAMAVRYAKDWPGAQTLPRGIGARVRERERRALQEAKRSGRSFVGPRRVLRLAHTKRARSYEEFGSLDPQFAPAGHREAAVHAVRRLRRFNAQYDKALHAWTSGDRNACFPSGTWWMRVCHGARCGLSTTPQTANPAQNPAPIKPGKRGQRFCPRIPGRREGIRTPDLSLRRG